MQITLEDTFENKLDIMILRSLSQKVYTHTKSNADQLGSSLKPVLEAEKHLQDYTRAHPYNPGAIVLHSEENGISITSRL